MNKISINLGILTSYNKPLSKIWTSHGHNVSQANVLDAIKSPII